MIDLHSHILHGVDDGAATLEDSVEMARSALADGVEALAATPHVRHDYPTSAALMERRLADLRDALAAGGVPLEVLPGGELDLEHMAGLTDGELRRFGLGGNPGFLLVEFPYAGWPLGLAERIFTLRTRGFRVVIAHPERSSEVQARPERLEPIVAAGALVQLTAASIDGRLGRRSREAAIELLERGLAHLVASDAHAPSIRQIGMRAAAESIEATVDGALARWLTADVPRAIVRGEPLPAPPSRPRKSRLRLLRRP
jgi:protein-tyrosine phosphatase